MTFAGKNNPTDSQHLVNRDASCCVVESEPVRTFEMPDGLSVERIFLPAKIPSHGGVRRGAGRKTTKPSVETFIEAFLVPAIIAAFNASPGQWKESYFTVYYNKGVIFKVYGKHALKEWDQWFEMIKPGGTDRFGAPLPTRWRLRFNKYIIAKRLIESRGHDVKSLPQVDLSALIQ